MFTIHVTNLITVYFLLFIKLQFTADDSDVVHLINYTQGHE
jgi:hypothetical protein